MQILDTGKSNGSKFYQQKGMIIVLLLLVGTITFSLTAADDPEYRGQKLSHWLTAWNKQRGGIGPNAFPNPPPDVVEALNAFGTNALPLMLEWLQLPSKTNEVYSTESPEFKRECVVRAFRVLGTNADPAIPELTRLLHTPDLRFWNAAHALVNLGLRTMPILTNALTSKEPLVRKKAAQYINMYGNKTTDGRLL